MSQPILLQRIEGALVLATALWLYHLGDGNWWLFALLLLTVDATIVGYLRGPKVGAWIYNAGHSYVLPGAIAIFSLITTTEIPPLLFIWFAHIGMDRMLGYGLKEASGFRRTHLGIIRKAKP